MERMHVLVIEDDDDIAELLTLQLEFGLGAIVTRARDGYVGLALLQSDRFDVAVLDLVLPGTPGLSILDQLQRRESRTPVVVLTGLGTAAAPEAARLGAHGLLTKPYQRTKLLDAVRAAAGTAIAV